MPGKRVEIMCGVEEEEEEVRENDGVELAITVIRYPSLGGGRGAAQETCTASRATCWAITLLGGSPVNNTGHVLSSLTTFQQLSIPPSLVTTTN